MRWKLLSLFVALGLILAAPAGAVGADEPKGESKKKQKDKSKESKGDKDSKKDADDDEKKLVEDSADDEASEGEGKKKEEKKVDPIKKLIEIEIDPFLVAERAINIPIPGRSRTMRDLLDRMEAYSKNDEVGALLLNLNGLSLPTPDIEELRAGVGELRKRGKKVMAYLNSGDPNSFLLACAADEVAIAPTGSLAIPGLGRLFPYQRGMFQMQGIEYDVITAGRFKYPGFMTARESNKYFNEEFNQILDDQFADYVSFIADGRKLSKDKVKELIDIAMFDAEDAKNRGLVDVIAYYEEYRDRVLKRHKYKKGEDGGADMSRITSLQDVFTAWSSQLEKVNKGYTEVGPKIAVVHARGPIVDMSLGSTFATQMIMRDDFVRTLEQVRKNKTIRAVVLRIDSPGGSGYASDIIWKKLRELDEEKPIVVSMGSVAGSGGYYIACPGRLIFAQPTTITGSIGVLAILANQASALNRMDVNIEEMKRGDRALLGSGHRDMATADREFIQAKILDFYEIFLDRVAAGRKMPKDQVRKLAEGRIYTGREALKIGLVDRLGGLKDAIAAAREMADIPPSAEIKLVHYPRPASFGELIESFAGLGMSMGALEAALQPVPRMGFNEQLSYFAQDFKPLCWMADPMVEALVSPGGQQQTMRELLGLPRAAILPVPLP